MDGSKWALGSTVTAAVIAAIASSYSAYASLNATREAAAVTASANIDIEKLRQQNSERQSDIEMIKLALNILGGEVSDKTYESRQFAIELLKKYSGVVLDVSMGQKWAASGSVSFAERDLGLSSIARHQNYSLAEKRALDRIIEALGSIPTPENGMETNP